MAQQRAGGLLSRVAGVFSNLVASLGGGALDAVDRVMSPRLAWISVRREVTKKADASFVEADLVTALA